MMKKKDISVDFGKIYLPDVFSKKEMSRTLVLLLLADLLKESGLPSRQVSLFALVDALLENKQNVELLSRGKLFENKYQALWPDTDVIRKETDEVYNRICEDGKFKEVMDVLLEFAEKLRLIVWSMTAEGNKPAETVEKETDLTASELTEQPEVRQKIIRAYVYEREFRRIKALPDFKKLLAWLNENQINLRQFKHKISIVFQNARDGELNLLFTGDAQPEHLKMIAENYDGKLPLYELQKNSVLHRSMEACFISRILICTVQIVTAATVTRTDVPVRRRMLSLLLITKIYKAVYFARIRLP